MKLPSRLAVSVALMAASLMLLEITATRVFSVLLFYHYSFFAVSVAMAGLALGGLWAARWPLTEWGEAAVRERLSGLAVLCGATALLLPPVLSVTRLISVIAFLPVMVLVGAFLAAAFGAGQKWIGNLYAADLAAAALACLLIIPAMRLVQGTPVLFVPALMATAAAWTLRPSSRHLRNASLAVGILAGVGIVIGIAFPSSVFHLRDRGGARPVLERWNEFSRVAAYAPAVPGQAYMLVIDRSAGTTLRLAGTPIQPYGPAMSRKLAFETGRAVGTVAIIGVGGGLDVYYPLDRGAAVDGFEINPIMAWLGSGALGAPAAYWGRPNLRLIIGEGRLAIAHAGKRYDVIQASLIDTWAATANGGFVLSENGLYTLEGWHDLLSSLSTDGVLTMTRWFIRDDPAEVQRLAVLAGSALQALGVDDPGRHVLIAADQNDAIGITTATILVSRSEFRPDEVVRLRARTQAWGGTLLVAPYTGGDAVLRGLLANRTRADLVSASRYDISAPTDARPYFFLQARLRDVLSGRMAGGLVREITFGGVRVMLLLTSVALALTLLVVLIALRTRPSGVTQTGRRSYRIMTAYFAAIGVGYMLIQLGLHQRLILVLGQPTLALAVVLCCMLLGSGIGARLSDRYHLHSRPLPAWLGILATLTLLVVAYPAAGLIGSLNESGARAAVAGAVVLAAGLPLGFAFPIGIRLVTRTVPQAVQFMWAVNGAASVCGSALAAMVGLVYGSRAVLLVGLAVYVTATIAGLSATAPLSRVSAPGTAMDCSAGACKVAAEIDPQDQ